MAKIIISGMEENKKPTTGTTGGITAGKTDSSGTSGTVTGTGGSSSTSGTSGSRFDFSSAHSGNKNSVSVPQYNVNTNQQKAETTLEQLKNDYSKKLRESYEYSAGKLRKERDDALRENWIQQEQAEAALPEQMAAAGINGGASESTLANLRARYQGAQNDIRKGYINNLGELAQQHSADDAQAQREYNERWLEYLLSLAVRE